METAQGEELYQAHNGEQMSLDAALERCPFLKSFGETALQEMRDELEAYKVLAETTTKTQEPKNIDAVKLENSLPEPEIKLVEAAAPEIFKAEPTGNIDNVENLEQHQDKGQNILAVEAAIQESQPHSAQADEVNLKPAGAVSQSGMKSPRATEAHRPKPVKSKVTAKPIKSKKVIQTPIEVTEAATEPAVLEEVGEAIKNIRKEEQVFELVETEPDSNDIIGQFVAGETAMQPEQEKLAVKDEELIKVSEEIFGVEADEPEQTQAVLELEKSFADNFEDLDIEEAVETVRTIEEAYVAVQEIAEILPEQELDLELSADRPGVDIELKEMLEIQIDRLENLCEQLLVRLELNAEPENVRLVMRLLLQPEFKEKLGTFIDRIYEKGTIEAKTTDTAALTGKVIKFVSRKEAKTAMLGRWALAQLNRSQAVAQPA